MDQDNNASAHSGLQNGQKANGDFETNETSDSNNTNTSKISWRLLGVIVFLLFVAVSLGTFRILSYKYYRESADINTNTEPGVAEKTINIQKSISVVKQDILPTTSAKNVSQIGKITLYGWTTQNGIKLTWKVPDLSAPNGFKIVRNITGNPSYPANPSQFVGSSYREYFMELKDGQNWHFRICQLDSDMRCQLYSNEIAVPAPGGKVPQKPVSQVKNIALTSEVTSYNSVILRWTTYGKSQYGFMVVWSKVINPSYPTRQWDSLHYLSNSEADNDTIESLESGETYFFRVCEYLDDKCGTFSNEISLRI